MKNIGTLGGGNKSATMCRKTHLKIIPFDFILSSIPLYSIYNILCMCVCAHVLKIKMTDSDMPPLP